MGRGRRAHARRHAAATTRGGPRTAASLGAAQRLGERRASVTSSSHRVHSNHYYNSCPRCCFGVLFGTFACMFIGPADCLARDHGAHRRVGVGFDRGACIHRNGRMSTKVALGRSAPAPVWRLAIKRHGDASCKIRRQARHSRDRRAWRDTCGQPPRGIAIHATESVSCACRSSGALSTRAPHVRDIHAVGAIRAARPPWRPSRVPEVRDASRLPTCPPKAKGRRMSSGPSTSAGQHLYASTGIQHSEYRNPRT